MQSTCTTTQQAVTGLERDVVALKREVAERDDTIGDKEKRIHDLKRKNQELEKFKFVLDYKIKELKRQIEPREAELARLKEQIQVRCRAQSSTESCMSFTYLCSRLNPCRVYKKTRINMIILCYYTHQAPRMHTGIKSRTSGDTRSTWHASCYGDE